ncbi:type II toxin-antitoxin system PemK/MazF family toxin [Anabaena subtropica]|uniref:Type II toxin-antitoxin system PemK/MazF family toxin n=1 Tax=Anabaena subtropica FACHB-260 TaxID=2692884 RepID=A0ABR8CPS4_9NOST|nr:type II toxin-antitoxin system PemK/MazF family toxin [Anabaena subtropica]MBD2345190.1 type II toxin-antitoxin system PemK/MazF family toxin [Anabaena subtropica FACHB-260]
MSLQKGDVVLVPFPFTDLTGTKLRPGLVLWVDSAGNDITVCFISSQNTNNLSPEEFVLEQSDTEFSGTGLKVISKVRVTRLVTLERRLITRRIGKLGANHIQHLNLLMLQAFQLT